ncbi:hypothetical protein D3C84_1296400 [compost metagenome]
MANEKARLPSIPGSSRLTYWPAWKAIGRSSFRCSPLMVGDKSTMALTVAVKSSTG